MQYGHWQTLLPTGIFTAILAGAHYLSPLIKKIHWLKARRITSFASGLVVAYVFLHMLPGLIESRDHIHQLLSNTTLMTQSKDLLIFVAALIGFEIFYCLERLSIGGHRSAAKLTQQDYRLHLGMYFIYNFLITYALLLSVEASIFYTIIYVITVSLHFVLTDNHFQRHFKHYFNAKSHLLLIVGLALGFLVSIALYPVQLYIAAIMTAFLSGAILYNAFREEITLTRDTSIACFFAGTLIIGILLGLYLKH